MAAGQCRPAANAACQFSIQRQRFRGQSNLPRVPLPRESFRGPSTPQTCGWRASPTGRRSSGGQSPPTKKWARAHLNFRPASKQFSIVGETGKRKQPLGTGQVQQCLRTYEKPQPRKPGDELKKATRGNKDARGKLISAARPAFATASSCQDASW